LKINFFLKKSINLLSKSLRLLYFGIVNLIQFKDIRIIFSCVISRRLPKTTKIPHPVGIVIGKPPGTQIGDNCIIMQNVTIGISKIGEGTGPRIGNNVFIGAGASILGNIRVGNYVTIGANSVVIKDIPDGSTVVGNPGRVIIK
jgi:serine O-acetyltransferase